MRRKWYNNDNKSIVIPKISENSINGSTFMHKTSNDIQKQDGKNNEHSPYLKSLLTSKGKKCPQKILPSQNISLLSLKLSALFFFSGSLSSKLETHPQTLTLFSSDFSLFLSLVLFTQTCSPQKVQTSGLLLFPSKINISAHPAWKISQTSMKSLPSLIFSSLDLSSLSN